LWADSHCCRRENVECFNSLATKAPSLTPCLVSRNEHLFLAQLPAGTAETRRMGRALRYVYLLALGVLGACANGGLQPQLVLEALAITRARTTLDQRELRQHYTLSAALSVPVDSSLMVAQATLQRDTTPGAGEVKEASAEVVVTCDDSEAHGAICAWAQSAEDGTWAALMSEPEGAQ
jgi:hypothetical protein